MTYVHHNTGEWQRAKDWMTATRAGGYIKEYNSLEEVDNAFVRQTFEWMLQIGEFVTASGSDVYQIRKSN